MKFSFKTALGIDISETSINLALLKRHKNDVQLIKVVSGPVPDGAIKKGNIEEPTIIAQAIKELRTRHKIRSLHGAAVSLLVEPALVEVLDTPKRITANVGQFVRNEVRSCVALSGKEAAFDFCGLAAPPGSPGSRLFLVATDNQDVAKLTKACNQTGLNLEAVEPPLLAYIRALFAKKIAGKLNSSVLIAILRGGILTLCVFIRETLDLVRVKKIAAERTEPGILYQWLEEEIDAIIRFYDVEVVDNPASWEITVIADDMQLPDNAEESLRAKTGSTTTLQVRTNKNAYLDTLVADESGAEKPSVVAVGLAMKLLNMDSTGLRINLIPPESAEVKAVKKDALIAANIVAVLFLLMTLAVGGLNLMTKKINQNTANIKQEQSLQETHALLKEKALIEEQITELSERPDYLESISNSHYCADWPVLLNDIRSRTPKTVRITKLSCKGDFKVSLAGQALSYQAVHGLVNMLDKSKYIQSASLVETERDSDGRFVMYVINCLLTGGATENDQW